MSGYRRRRCSSWKNLKPRLGLKGINVLGCCGSSNWVLDDNVGEQPLMVPEDDYSPATFETINQESCIGHIPGDNTTMNLATALAADRRQMNVGHTDGIMLKPLKSIVRLFEEMDGRDVAKVSNKGCDGGIGTLCCLCTERNKGAALIPCGHTYCRVCSRAMWSNQGSCPLCNRLITEILEIF